MLWIEVNKEKWPQKKSRIWWIKNLFNTKKCKLFFLRLYNKGIRLKNANRKTTKKIRVTFYLFYENLELLQTEIRIRTSLPYCVCIYKRLVRLSAFYDRENFSWKSNNNNKKLHFVFVSLWCFVSTITTI